MTSDFKTEKIDKIIDFRGSRACLLCRMACKGLKLNKQNGKHNNRMTKLTVLLEEYFLKEKCFHSTGCAIREQNTNTRKRRTHLKTHCAFHTAKIFFVFMLVTFYFFKPKFHSKLSIY